jgi:GNAT superfamily N-acetyltransferase
MHITQAQPSDAPIVAEMVGELVREIMAVIGEPAFRFDRANTEARAQHWLAHGLYKVFLARDLPDDRVVGFLALYESYGLYADGAFGTIPELYVRVAYRSRGVGASLLAEARRHGISQGWTRLEVTTPPLPQFKRTLAFYERQGFGVSGGRKLKVDLP